MPEGKWAAHARFGRQGEATHLSRCGNGPSFSLLTEFSEGPASHPGSRTGGAEKPSGPHFYHLGYTQDTVLPRGSLGNLAAAGIVRSCLPAQSI